MKLKRFETNPIITPHMDERMGDNINGPSLIRVPDWLPNPLGKYYLYFAHHKGEYIRMAYADQLEGPWKIHSPGVLALEDTPFPRHIASPDVLVLEEQKELRMYYHGCCFPEPPSQRTCLALSSDGLTFKSNQDFLGSSYFRAFYWEGFWYTLEMPGLLRRSPNGIEQFEAGHSILPQNARHSALQIKGNTLYIFYSLKQTTPEHIVYSTVDLSVNWTEWKATEPQSLIKPELDYEGVHEPLVASEGGYSPEPVHQLRDPGIFEEDGKTYLLYSVAGERGIAIAEIQED